MLRAHRFRDFKFAGDLASIQKCMTSYASAYGVIKIVAISVFSSDDFWKQVQEKDQMCICCGLLHIEGTCCLKSLYLPIISLIYKYALIIVLYDAKMTQFRYVCPLVCVC